ncbi:hypothetical protein HDU76_005464 [Blyttiomyces sp. JEL0837]|nr:hypothetical protein HDU76_005464 [Blyttiomyces sp. JEL0837]
MLKWLTRSATTNTPPQQKEDRTTTNPTTHATTTAPTSNLATNPAISVNNYDDDIDGPRSAPIERSASTRREFGWGGVGQSSSGDKPPEPRDRSKAAIDRLAELENELELMSSGGGISDDGENADNDRMGRGNFGSSNGAGNNRRWANNNNNNNNIRSPVSENRGGSFDHGERDWNHGNQSRNGPLSPGPLSPGGRSAAGGQATSWRDRDRERDFAGSNGSPLRDRSPAGSDAGSSVSGSDRRKGSDDAGEFLSMLKNRYRATPADNARDFDRDRSGPLVSSDYGDATTSNSKTTPPIRSPNSPSTASNRMGAPGPGSGRRERDRDDASSLVSPGGGSNRGWAKRGGVVDVEPDNSWDHRDHVRDNNEMKSPLRGDFDFVEDDDSEAGNNSTLSWGASNERYGNDRDHGHDIDRGGHAWRRGNEHSPKSPPEGGRHGYNGPAARERDWDATSPSGSVNSRGGRDRDYKEPEWRSPTSATRNHHFDEDSNPTNMSRSASQRSKYSNRERDPGAIISPTSGTRREYERDIRDREESGAPPMSRHHRLIKDEESAGLPRRAGTAGGWSRRAQLYQQQQEQQRSETSLSPEIKGSEDTFESLRARRRSSLNIKSEYKTQPDRDSSDSYQAKSEDRVGDQRESGISNDVGNANVQGPPAATPTTTPAVATTPTQPPPGEKPAPIRNWFAKLVGVSTSPASSPTTTNTVTTDAPSPGTPANNTGTVAGSNANLSKMASVEDISGNKNAASSTTSSISSSSGMGDYFGNSKPMAVSETSSTTASTSVPATTPPATVVASPPASSWFSRFAGGAKPATAATTTPAPAATTTSAVSSPSASPSPPPPPAPAVVVSSTAKPPPPPPASDTSSIQESNYRAGYGNPYNNNNNSNKLSYQTSTTDSLTPPPPQTKPRTSTDSDNSYTIPNSPTTATTPTTTSYPTYPRRNFDYLLEDDDSPPASPLPPHDSTKGPMSDEEIRLRETYRTLERDRKSLQEQYQTLTLRRGRRAPQGPGLDLVSEERDMEREREFKDDYSVGTGTDDYRYDGYGYGREDRDGDGDRFDRHDKEKKDVDRFADYKADRDWNVKETTATTTSPTNDYISSSSSTRYTDRIGAAKTDEPLFSPTSTSPSTTDTLQQQPPPPRYTLTPIKLDKAQICPEGCTKHSALLHKIQRLNSKVLNLKEKVSEIQKKPWSRADEVIERDNGGEVVVGESKVDGGDGEVVVGEKDREWSGGKVDVLKEDVSEKVIDRRDRDDFGKGDREWRERDKEDVERAERRERREKEDAERAERRERREKEDAEWAERRERREKEDAERAERRERREKEDAERAERRVRRDKEDAKGGDVNDRDEVERAERRARRERERQNDKGGDMKERDRDDVARRERREKEDAEKAERREWKEMERQTDRTGDVADRDEVERAERRARRERERQSDKAGDVNERDEVERAERRARRERERQSEKGSEVTDRDEIERAERRARREREHQSHKSGDTNERDEIERAERRARREKERQSHKSGDTNERDEVERAERRARRERERQQRERGDIVGVGGGGSGGSGYRDDYGGGGGNERYKY